jgi:large subunit ribosomal protein L28
MGRVCQLTGAKPSKGNRVRYRGKAKYLGGIGKKITSITRRSWCPNLQKVTALIDGKPTRIRVTAKAIKSGMVTKPLKRKFGYTRQQKKQGVEDA